MGRVQWKFRLKKIYLSKPLSVKLLPPWGIFLYNTLRSKLDWFRHIKKSVRAAITTQLVLGINIFGKRSSCKFSFNRSFCGLFSKKLASNKSDLSNNQSDYSIQWVRAKRLTKKHFEDTEYTLPSHFGEKALYAVVRYNSSTKELFA